MVNNDRSSSANSEDFDWKIFLKSVRDGNSLDLSKKNIAEIPNKFFELYSNLQVCNYVCL